MPRFISPFVLVVFLFFYNPLTAQETTSEISGIVTGNGAALAGATVKAVHQPSQTSYSTTTRKDGRYNLPNLKVGGPYTLYISFVGFVEEKKESITLFLGQEATADIVLNPQVKSLAHVTVQSQQQDKVFNDNHTGSQDIISLYQIQRLPTIDRSLADFLKLTPSFNNFSFAGRNRYYNSITIDGASLDNIFDVPSTLGTNISGQPISLEDIEQIQVNISPYDVRQGGFSGAQVNVVTRSGSNKFKGSAYAYNNGIGTLGYRVGNQRAPVEDFNYNELGFSVSGPIKKDKLFFFFNAEDEILNSAGTTFKASGTPGTYGDDISLANADTLSILRQFLIDRFQYDPGKFQDYTLKTRKYKMSAKIDWNINSKNTFTLKYNFFNSSKDYITGNINSPSGGRQPSYTALPFSNGGYTNFNNYNVLIAELNTQINNRVFNKFQAGYTKIKNFRRSLGSSDFPFVDILNGSGQSYTSFGYEPISYNNILNVNLFQVADIFSLYKGDHEITFGTQDYFKSFKTGFAPFYNGIYRFNSLQDFYNNVNNNVPNTYRYILQYTITKDNQFPFPEINSTELGFFAQDKWKLKKNLSVTYGLRIDVPVFYNKLTPNPHVASFVFRDGKQYNVGQTPGNNFLFSPRAGFNWDVTDDKKLQIRGGAGLFAGPPPYIWLSNLAANNGMQFGTLATNRILFSPNRETYLPPPGTTENTSYSLAFATKDFKFPQALKASLAVDKRLPGNILATLEAIYSKDISAVFFQNVNLPSEGTALQGSDDRIRYISSQIYAGLPTPTVTNPDIRDAVLMTNSKKGYAYAFTLELQKTSGNFFFGASYTYSKAKTVSDGGYFQSNIWRDRPVTGDPNAEELGLADFYLPHRVMAYASYRKEYAKHFATSVGIVFEASPSGVGSYTYKGDLNNDGVTNNDLIYIPKDKNDIVLVPDSKNGNDTRTADEIWDQLNNYINQDRYLNKHRGEVAKRNAVVFPFYKRLDLNIMQEFFIESKTTHVRHTLSVTFDILNLGNFFNKNWGSYQTFTSIGSYTPYTSGILQFEGVASGAENNAGKPKFSFPYLDATYKTPLQKSFSDDISVLSRWQAQIGARYTFK